MNFLDRKTAYVFEESYMWHNPGGINPTQAIHVYVYSCTDVFICAMHTHESK